MGEGRGFELSEVDVGRTEPRDAANWVPNQGRGQGIVPREMDSRGDQAVPLVDDNFRFGPVTFQILGGGVSAWGEA